MDNFELHDEVVIRNFGIKGAVIGVWFDEDGNKKYLVRYIDANGVINEQWFGQNGLNHA